MSAKLSLLTSPLLFVSDLVLLLLLKYSEKFTYSESIVLEKDTTIHILMTYLLPMGAITMISNFLYAMSTTMKKMPAVNYFSYDYMYIHFSGALVNKFKSCLQYLGFLLVLIGVLVASGLAIASIYDGNRTFHMSEVSSNLDGKQIV